MDLLSTERMPTTVIQNYCTPFGFSSELFPVISTSSSPCFHSSMTSLSFVTGSKFTTQTLPQGSPDQKIDFLLSPMETVLNSNENLCNDFQNVLQDTFVTMETEQSDNQLALQYQRDVDQLNSVFDFKMSDDTCYSVSDITSDLIYSTAGLRETSHTLFVLVLDQVQHPFVSYNDHVTVVEDESSGSSRTRRRSKKKLFECNTCSETENHYDFVDGFRPLQ